MGLGFFGSVSDPVAPPLVGRCDGVGCVLEVLEELTPLYLPSERRSEARVLF